MLLRFKHVHIRTVSWIFTREASATVPMQSGIGEKQVDWSEISLSHESPFILQITAAGSLVQVLPAWFCRYTTVQFSDSMCSSACRTNCVGPRCGNFQNANSSVSFVLTIVRQKNRCAGVGISGKDSDTVESSPPAEQRSRQAGQLFGTGSSEKHGSLTTLCKLLRAYLQRSTLGSHRECKYIDVTTPKARFSNPFARNTSASTILPTTRWTPHEHSEYRKFSRWHCPRGWFIDSTSCADTSDQFPSCDSPVCVNPSADVQSSPGYWNVFAKQLAAAANNVPFERCSAVDELF